MPVRHLSILILISLVMTGFEQAAAQVGGQRSFEFQNVPINPRQTGLGGVVVSIPGEELGLIFANPALSTDSLTGNASLSYASYFADINVASFAYQHDLGKFGHWFIGAIHFDYGDLEGRDATGMVTDDFNASETLLVLGRSHAVGNFRLGGSVRFFYASLAEYNASALALDLGGLFQHPEKEFNVGLVFKNVGFVISNYTPGSDSQLPFDIQIGSTFKPEHMPIRFTFSAYNLYKGDIAYFNTGSPQIEDEPGVADKVLRHFAVGAELLLTRSVNLRFGYNHLIRQELKLEETGGGAGFSYGLQFKINAFAFSYSRGGYHASGGLHNFGISANTNLFFKKKSI
ncbi:MAG: type IX secretion system protein PorQ [Fulvivirga sp.]|nr:type IX secretion system protein PorQ [Fulvivirga sp.]